MRTALTTVTMFIAATAVACTSDATLNAPNRAALFAKTTETDPTATVGFPINDSGLGLRGDGLFSDGTNSVFAEGVCGVSTRIFASPSGSNSGDLTLQTDNPTYRDHKCQSYPRKLTLAYDDGLVEHVTVFMNLHEIENSTFSIAIGDSTLRAMGLSQMSASRCGAGKVQWGGGGNGDSLWVKRVSSTSWSVHTQLPPNDRAFCTVTSTLYHMPVQFSVTASRALP